MLQSVLTSILRHYEAYKTTNKHYLLHQTKPTSISSREITEKISDDEFNKKQLLPPYNSK